MKNKLLVNGCSYTYGIGTTKIFDSTERLDLCYGGVLGKKLDYEVSNRAQPGSSNDRILRSTLDEFAHNRPDIAIVMWSDPDRIEFYRPPDVEYTWQSLVQVTPQGVNNVKSWYHREALEQYFSFIHSDERGVLHTATQMQAIQYAAEALDIKLIQFHYKDHFNRAYTKSMGLKKEYKDSLPVQTYLKELESISEFFKDRKHAFGFDDNTSFGRLRIEWNDPDSDYSGGHPGIEGHKLMADWFYEYIENNNLR